MHQNALEIEVLTNEYIDFIRTNLSNIHLLCTVSTYNKTGEIIETNISEYNSSLNLSSNQSITLIFIDLHEQLPNELKTVGLPNKCDIIKFKSAIEYYKYNLVDLWEPIVNKYLVRFDILPRTFMGSEKLVKIELSDISLRYYGFELFKDCVNLKYVIMKHCDISLIDPIHMKGNELVVKGGNSTNWVKTSLFDGCNNIEELDLESSVINNFGDNTGFGYFSNLKKLRKVSLKGCIFDNPIGAFKDCISLEDVDLSNADFTSNVDTGKGIRISTWCNNMFEGCIKLKHINLNGLVINSNCDFSMDCMFNRCSSLEYMDLSEILINGYNNKNINEEINKLHSKLTKITTVFKENLDNNLYEEFEALNLVKEEYKIAIDNLLQPDNEDLELIFIKPINMFKGCYSLKNVIKHKLIVI